MIQRFADGHFHVSGLGQSDDWAVARADGDFCFMTVLLDGQNYFGFEFIAKNFADF